MDMSVNPGGTDQVDYSDFEYQTVDATLVAQESSDATGGGNILARSLFNAPVLDGVGGLDNNEVAELVYLETSAHLLYNDNSNDQDVASTGNATGVVGANLASTDDSFPAVRSSGTTGEVVSTVDIDEANITNLARGGTEDRWFQPFTATASTPFDDQTNGPGGSGDADGFYAEKPFRTMVGRGPVLDSSDDMSIAVQLSVDDTIIDARATVNCHMVWDVAETSDAGRAFSVPMDD